MIQGELPVNTSFSKILPTLQIALDSTSMGAFKNCPQYYKYVIVDGYQGRGENVHFRFGIEYHKATEDYDHLRAKGENHADALRETVKQTMIRTWNFDTQRPWMSDNPNKTRETLIRSVIWYLEQFKDDPLETIILDNGKAAVELSFRFASGIFAEATTGEEFILCGHLDRLVKWMEKTWILDKKTTKYSLDERFFDKFNPDNQMSTYNTAGRMVFFQPIDGIIIDGAQIGATFTRFQRGFTNRTPAHMEEWLEDMRFWTRQLEACAKANYWPKNDTACNKYLGCEFREVCAVDPSLRQRHLDQLYTRRVWDPLVTREV